MASIGTAICVAEHHVHIVFDDPSTYLSPLHHKCGLLMLLCHGWLVAEVLALSTESSGLAACVSDLRVTLRRMS